MENISTSSLIIADLVSVVVSLVSFLVILVVAKLIKEKTTAYSVKAEIIEQDNPAVALATTGYYLGIVAIYLGAYLGPSKGMFIDTAMALAYAAIGVLLMNASRVINDKLILRGIDNNEQLTQAKNMAVGWVLFGSYLATGLVAAAAVSGQGGGLISTLVFFVLGQFTLVVFALIYDRLTPYSLLEELAKANQAAGVAFGGSLIGLGLIVANASAGDFYSWTADLFDFVIMALIAFIFLPLMRMITDRILLSGSNLAKEIAEDQNLGAGFLEAAMAVSFALVLIYAI